MIHPLFLYGACVLGAVGVAVAMPRREFRLTVFGVLLAGAAALLVLVPLSVTAFMSEGGDRPNVFFYAFAAIALLASLRVITHHRPVYSALYFILTIIATSGLFILLSAEFMGFALIIIYAGAILITYLFVIMLATQAPAEGDEELQADYDTTAREPWLASVAGFLVLGVLTVLMFRGVDELPAGEAEPNWEVLAELPGKVETALRDTKRAGEEPLLAENETLRRMTDADGHSLGRLVTVEAGFERVVIAESEGEDGDVVGRPIPLPAEMRATNVERLGINLLRDHPMTIEIAGIILLMAMLGATVLARKHVELEEFLKAKEARRLHDAAAEKRGAAEG